jgi:hypothetical protein
MISSRLFKAFTQRGLVCAAQATPFYNTPVRFFAKEGKDAAEPAVEAAEPVAAKEPKPAPKQAAAAAPKKAAQEAH